MDSWDSPEPSASFERDLYGRIERERKPWYADWLPQALNPRWAAGALAAGLLAAGVAESCADGRDRSRAEDGRRLAAGAVERGRILQRAGPGAGRLGDARRFRRAGTAGRRGRQVVMLSIRGWGAATLLVGLAALYGSPVLPAQSRKPGRQVNRPEEHGPASASPKATAQRSGDQRPDATADADDACSAEGVPCGRIHAFAGWRRRGVRQLRNDFKSLTAYPRNKSS